MLKIDPIWQPDVQQKNFRLVLDAMSYPGRCFSLHTLPDEGPVVLSILATLLDAEVSLSDPHNLLRADDWLMLQQKNRFLMKLIIFYAMQCSYQTYHQNWEHFLTLISRQRLS